MREINPNDTTRAEAFKLWIRHMVTVFKTIDVTKILKYSKKNKLKFNMLMCYAIGSAANL